MVCPRLAYIQFLDFLRSLGIWVFEEAVHTNIFGCSLHGHIVLLNTHGFSCTSESQKSSSRSSQRSVEPSHSFPCLSALHTWSCRGKPSICIDTDTFTWDNQSSIIHAVVSMCVVVPAGAALLHDLSTMVAREFTEAIIAIDDRPLHDLSVSQHKIGIWPQKPISDSLPYFATSHDWKIIWILHTQYSSTFHEGYNN